MKKIILLLGAMIVMTSLYSVKKGPEITYYKEGIEKKITSLDEEEIDKILESAVSPFYLALLEEDLEELKKTGEYIDIKYDSPRTINLGGLGEKNISRAYLVIESEKIDSNSALLILEDGNYEVWMLD